MPGFSNNVMYAGNVDFTGNPIVSGEVTTNGQLLIGSTVAPKIRVGSLTSGDGSIAITPGAGTIDLATTGPLGGVVEQIVYNSVQTLINCFNPIPFDNTIPQQTEGNEILTVTITPKSATDILVIDFNGIITANAPLSNTIALFQDGNLDAIAVACQGTDAFSSLPTTNDSISLRWVMLAGTTVATTFKIRVGNEVGDGSTYGAIVNGGWDSGAGLVQQLYNGKACTSLTVTEYKPTGTVLPTFGWNQITSADNIKTISTLNGYITKGAGACVMKLPAAANQGDIFAITGYGNLWTLTQNAGQQISYGVLSTTLGVGGSITATHVKDSVVILCVTNNTEFQIIESIGNIALV